MTFFSADGVPQVTAKFGTPEWEKEVVEYNKWLDQCYAEAGERDGEVDEESELLAELNRGYNRDRI